MAKKILVADLLCGAGGSTEGCERALLELGFSLDEIEFVAVNHWPTAIRSHAINHPRARHYVQDIATVRPHLLVPEGYLDLLMASPTCTHHSNARGGKPTSDQQRSDPWHIITWLTELRVKRLIIENVWEFIKWGPVDRRTGRPIKSREGEYFWAWISAIKALGFSKIEWRKLNAADYGDATTRSRFILMARSDGKPVQFPAATHARRPNSADLFETLQPWRPAREIIDWDIRGRSIFNRDKSLAPKTLERIWAGAVKHGWPQPFLVILRNHMASQGIDVPLPAIMANGGHIGLAQPIVGTMKAGCEPRTAAEPLHTPTTQASLFTAEPLVMNGRRGNKATPADRAPIPTLDTKGGVWVVEPFIASVAHGNSPADTTADSRRCKSLDDPLGTFHAGGGRFAVVEPFMLSQGAGGVARATTQPVPAIPTHGAHALIAPYYSNGWQRQAGAPPPCYTTEDPVPPITTKGRFGVVVPVTQSKRGNIARSTEEPIPTATTARGGEFAIVMPVTHHDGSNRTRDVRVDPIPTPTGANRGELAFIAAQFGERPGQAPRTHSIAAPTPSIAATGHINLVQGVEDLRGYDILFRMLEPHELAAAMGFDGDGRHYTFAGTKTEQIKQIGNAVSVRKMKACVMALMADAVPGRRTAPQPPRELAA